MELERAAGLETIEGHKAMLALFVCLKGQTNNISVVSHTLTHRPTLLDHLRCAAVSFRLLVCDWTVFIPLGYHIPVAAVDLWAQPKLSGNPHFQSPMLETDGFSKVSSFWCVCETFRTMPYNALSGLVTVLWFAQ